MTMSKLPNPALDRVERDYLKYCGSFRGRSWTYVFVGVAYVAMIVVAFSMGLSRDQVAVLRIVATLSIGGGSAFFAVAPFFRERRAVRDALVRLPSVTMDAATRWSSRVLLRGSLRCIEPGLAFVFHDPKSPGLVGWIEDPDLSVWIARGGKVTVRTGALAIHAEDDVTLQVHATPLTDVPPMLQRWLSESSYREPPKVIHLTCSTDEPLRIIVNR